VSDDDVDDVQVERDFQAIVFVNMTPERALELARPFVFVRPAGEPETFEDMYALGWGDNKIALALDQAVETVKKRRQRAGLRANPEYHAPALDWKSTAGIEMRARVRRMYDDGVSASEIGKTLGLTFASVKNQLQHYRDEQRRKVAA
jgi:DNA-directed RNA polymerase specialized sigma24 family protein